MAKPRRGRGASPGIADLLVLDAASVTRAAAGDRRVAAWLERARELDAELVVSAVTVAEVVRGLRADATASRVVKASDVFPADETMARSAGALLGHARSSETLDAFVAATASAAIERLGATRCVVLTSDPGDLDALLASEPRAQVIGV